MSPISLKLGNTIILEGELRPEYIGYNASAIVLLIYVVAYQKELSLTPLIVACDDT